MEGGALLPPFIVAHAIALGGQFNSSSMLLGMARYRAYAIILLTEAAFLAVGAWWIWPHVGPVGVAYVVSGCVWCGGPAARSVSVQCGWRRAERRVDGRVIG